MGKISVEIIIKGWSQMLHMSLQMDDKYWFFGEHLFFLIFYIGGKKKNNENLY